MDPQTPYLDFLILADRAEAINGKLYLMGGGWDTFNIGNDEPASFSVALAIMMPWHATNQDHMLTLSLQDADANELLRVQAGLRTGRPPTMAEPAEQRVMIAFPVSVRFPTSGTYAVIGTIGDNSKRVSLHVNQVPQMPFFVPPATP